MLHRQTIVRNALNSQIQRILKKISSLEARRNRFSPFRPVLFFLGAAGAYWIGWVPAITAGSLLFLDSIYFHWMGKILQRYRIWHSIKTDQIARMDLDWPRIRKPFSPEPIPGHPFESDLDISGPHSLHHLLDTAVSREGSRRLHQWLSQTTPQPSQIRNNQQMVRELAPLSRFRDKLLLNFHLVSREQLETETLLRWLGLHSGKNPLRKAVFLSSFLIPLNLLLFLGYQMRWIPGFWLITLIFYLLIYFWHAGILKVEFDAVMHMSEQLGKFRRLLTYLETYPYRRDSRLWHLCKPFHSPETLPSRQLRRITWLTNAVGLRMNPITALLLNLFLPYDLLLAHAIHQDKNRYRTLFPLWVETWSDLEALVSLANHAYLHPDNTFPEILPRNQASPVPLFQVLQLGHPLIPSPRRVGNDLILQKEGDLKMVTGSNMAGKSTFLKALGINLCLAYCGGAVYARSLQTIVFRIFTCMQVRDSVQDGFSFFYAEVKRLRALLDTLNKDHTFPVFFLIDEIFRGTNSREHLIGSRAYIFHLAQHSCVGLISTHDVALGRLETILPGLENIHFRDDVLDGKMRFDYRIYSGICPTTNALTIMRMEGLPVDQPD